MRLKEMLEHLGATIEGGDPSEDFEVVIEVEAGRKTVKAEFITARFDYAESKAVIVAEEMEGD